MIDSRLKVWWVGRVDGHSGTLGAIIIIPVTVVSSATFDNTTVDVSWVAVTRVLLLTQNTTAPTPHLSTTVATNVCATCDALCVYPTTWTALQLAVRLKVGIPPTDDIGMCFATIRAILVIARSASHIAGMFKFGIQPIAVVKGFLVSNVHVSTLGACRVEPVVVIRRVLEHVNLIIELLDDWVVVRNSLCGSLLQPFDVRVCQRN